MVRALLELVALLVTVGVGTSTLYRLYRRWRRRHHRIMRIVNGDEERLKAAAQLHNIRTEYLRKFRRP